MQTLVTEGGVLTTLASLEDWVARHEYKGYEPFDGLSSFLHPLTFGNLLLERLLQQAVRQSPINLRPILGVRPQESTKGRGYMAWGYLELCRALGDNGYEASAHRCLKWLDDHRSPGYPDHAWGNHFDFSSRIGKLPKFEPIIVWTSLIGQAYLDAYELLEKEWYLEVARSVCEWILKVPRETTDEGSCLSYVAFEQRSIHNSNMLGAAMLARTGSLTGEAQLLDVAREAMRYSCARQRPDGSWYYGEGEGYHWIDCFHTGYNLDSLRRYILCTDDAEFLPNLRSGLEYFAEHFIEAEGMVRYYHDRLYPIDIQCVAQAIDTLALCSDLDSSYLDSARKVAQWAIASMQNRDGSFSYRLLPAFRVRTPMLHWGQGTMFKALATLLKMMKKATSRKVAASVKAVSVKAVSVREEGAGAK